MTQQNDTREAILKAATDIARRRGFTNIRKPEVAKLAGVATGTIFYHYDSMDALRTEVLRHAIEREDLPLIAQGLAHHHACMRQLPEGLKRRAALCLA